MSTCMAHPPVTQPGPADRLAIWLNTQDSDTTKQSQGRGILESLDPMPAFTNRARKRAIALRKHPSGKLHLIIMGNCVIRLESRTQHTQKWNFRRVLLAGDLQVPFSGCLSSQFKCHFLFQVILNSPKPRWLIPSPYSRSISERQTLIQDPGLPPAPGCAFSGQQPRPTGCTSDP